jgi:hypothetical protein
MLPLVAVLLTARLTQPVPQRPPDKDSLRDVIDLTYEPARDQAKLQKPASWCAPLRPADPLLKDARKGALDGLYLLGIVGGSLYPVSPRIVRVIRDEKTCETAARRYDTVKFGGGSTSLEDHPAIHAVIVIAVGDAYLVEDATERGVYWVVAGFDHEWHELGSYGAGA